MYLARRPGRQPSERRCRPSHPTSMQIGTGFVTGIFLGSCFGLSSQRVPRAVYGLGGRLEGSWLKRRRVAQEEDPPKSRSEEVTDGTQRWRRTQAAGHETRRSVQRREDFQGFPRRRGTTPEDSQT